MSMFTHAILGGTFDHFHKGHEHFLLTAFSKSEHLTIGITTPALFLHKPQASKIEDFSLRKKSVEEFLTSRRLQERVDIIPIADIYGTSLTDETIEAIFIVPSGKENAKLINMKRKQRNFPELKIVVVDEIDARDGSTLSSRRIRLGEINRNGDVYLSLFNKNLQMPESLRSTLQAVSGETIKSIQDIVVGSPLVITVGDIVSVSAVKDMVTPGIMIFDHRTGRETITDPHILSLLPRPTQTVQNVAATISNDAANSIHTAIKAYLQEGEKAALRIEGEEDLLALPAILLAPLGSAVVYGEKLKGMTVMHVDEERKAEIVQLIKQFEQV